MKIGTWLGRHDREEDTEEEGTEQQIGQRRMIPRAVKVDSMAPAQGRVLGGFQDSVEPTRRSAGVTQLWRSTACVHQLETEKGAYGRHSSSHVGPDTDTGCRAAPGGS